MTNEEIISEYMQKHYDDQALASLLAHAEDGKLSYWSCSCFIGVPSAVRASVLHGECGPDCCPLQFASTARRDIPEADGAEDAFFDLGRTDAERRDKLIPLIKTEMARRESLRSESPEFAEVQAR